VAERSPAAWLELLERRLHDRWNRWHIFDDYYEGDQYVSALLRSVQRHFQGTTLGNILNGLTNNYMPLVVDSVAERLRVQGFRFGDDSSADDDAGRIWRANDGASQSNMLHTESIKLGEGYWMVTPNGDNPILTCEHPSQVIVAHAPGNRRNRLAALKKWNDDDGYTYANVYLPRGVVKYRSKEPRGQVDRLNWTQVDSFSNKLGEVPLIPMPNNPSMLRGGRSDLSFGAISVQDQITKGIVDLMIGAEYVGLPQRVMLGVEPPRDPATGRVIDSAKVIREKVLYFNSPDAKLGEFGQADLKGLRSTVDSSIGDLAAQTRIPIYYFQPTSISNISADALVGFDAALVSKGKDKEAPFGGGHVEAMRLCFKSIDPDDPRANSTEGRTIWANTESRSQAQLTDAVSKEVAIGLPFEAALEKLGYPPEEIDRILTMQAAAGITLEAESAEPSPVPPTD
jgi:hypothetical protein